MMIEYDAGSKPFCIIFFAVTLIKTLPKVFPNALGRF